MWKFNPHLLHYQISFFINPPVDTIKLINPKMNNGILSIHIPRTNTTTETRTITNS